MDEKARLRAAILAERDRTPDREEKSAAIRRYLLALPEYGAAGVLGWFVGVKSEVETLPAIGAALAGGRQVVVPWVSPTGLRLFQLRSVEELEPARFGLLEPAPQLRADARRELSPAAVDFFVVPGVAFDRAGGRLGHGKAYYDRLLAGARPDAIRTGICFSLQLVPKVPMSAHDVLMHQIVTERGVIRVSQDGHERPLPTQ